MEVGLHEGSRNPEEEERGLKKASNEDVVMNLNCESPKAQNVCRICHLDSSEVVPLGCDCRGELGLSHHNCAEAWFSQKGNIFYFRFQFEGRSCNRDDTENSRFNKRLLASTHVS
ncbi:hypothetical protein ACS0TY_017581 [Phlomoides rotata]